jgi:hypothetical protein
LGGTPGFPKTHALADVVETEGIGKREPIAAGNRGVIGLKRLINDPAKDEETEDAAHILVERL